jgi:hypothetical protein
MPLLWQSLGSGIAEPDFCHAWERIQYPDFELFCVSDDEKWLFSARLTRESDEVLAYVEKRQIAGIKGASMRWAKDQSCASKQTHSKRIANACQTHSNTDTDISIPPTPLPSPRKGKRCIPHDFKITDDMRAWFAAKGFSHIEIDKATEQFVNYWQSSGKQMKDWAATWRNGMIKAEQWAAEKAPARTGPNYKHDKCRACGMQASNIMAGQNCPYCGKRA